jgi:hypothetical protein
MHVLHFVTKWLLRPIPYFRYRLQKRVNNCGIEKGIRRIKKGWLRIHSTYPITALNLSVSLSEHANVINPVHTEH